MKTIGFIGCGIMGKPMASNLLKAGYKVFIYDINPEPLEELKKLGANVSLSISEVAQECSIILTMLPNSKDSEDVIIGRQALINSVKKGSTIVDMSSIDPIISIKIGDKLSMKGIGFLDAPVSGGEPKAKDGTLAIMVGGKRVIFDKIIPIFKVLGSTYKLVGEIGAGNFTKLCNQIIVAINIAAISEALILAKKSGISLNNVYEAIRGGLAGSTVLDAKFSKIINRNFKPGFKIKLHQKDLQNVLNAGAALNIPLPISAYLLEILKSLTTSGDGELDHCGIIRFYEKISSIEVK